MRYVMPLDPECPAVQERDEMMANDPMTAYSCVGDELQEEFHRQHLLNCERCKEYGCANIEVVE